MLLRRVVVLAAFTIMSMTTASPAQADPQPDPPPVDAADAAQPPVDDGRVPSAEPATTKTPDGWTLTVSSKDETQLPVAPLTTAVSTREYLVGGHLQRFPSGSWRAARDPRGGLRDRLRYRHEHFDRCVVDGYRRHYRIAWCKRAVRCLANGALAGSLRADRRGDHRRA